MTSQDILLVFDVHSLMNRAFYGIAGRQRLTAPDGTPTGALFAFLNMILKYKDEIKPSHVLSAMDMPGDTFRHKMFEGYKAGRSPMPEDLALQIPLARDLLSALGFQPLGLDLYEADDLIGTAARKGEEAGMQVYIVTGDKDILQLISDQTSVVLLTTRKTGSESEIMTPESMEEEYGVSPEEWLDVKALMGDASDKIPGVKGVGAKTALRLIAEYGSLDAVYENLDRQKGALRTNLEAGKEDAYLSRELSEIHREAPIPDLDGLISRESRELFDREALTALFTRLGFRSFLERFELEAGEPDEERPELSASPDLDRFMEEVNDEDSLAFFLPQKGEKGLLVSSKAYAEFEDTDRLFSLLAERHNTFLTWDMKGQLRKADRKAPSRAADDLMIAAYLLNQLGRGGDVEYALRAVLGADYRPLPQDSLPLLEDRLETKKALALQLLPALPLQKEELNLRGLDRLYQVEKSLTLILADMEKKGILIDREALEATSAEMAQELSRLEESIYRDAGKAFNINSPQQLSEVLYTDLDLPTGRKSATGQYSTAAEELDRLRGYHPIIPAILDYRELSKLRGTFLEGLKKEIKGDGRVHTSYNQTVVTTGRLSSSNPNLQNIPIRTDRGSKIRELFIAPAGRLLVGADYSQIELRLLAHLSGDENLSRAFLEGRDVHLVTASTLYAKPEEEVTPAERSVAKTVNFSITYGISDFGLSRDLDIPIYEARELIDRFHAKYPGVEAWMQNQGELAKERGYVETLFHRRRYVPELQSQNRNTYNFGLRAAMNAPVQGTAADLIKMAMVDIEKLLKKEGLDADLLLQVHDELILEADEKSAPRVAALLKKAMEEAMPLDVPLVADVRFGRTWGDLK